MLQTTDIDLCIGSDGEQSRSTTTATAATSRQRLQVDCPLNQTSSRDDPEHSDKPKWQVELAKDWEKEAELLDIQPSPGASSKRSNHTTPDSTSISISTLNTSTPAHVLVSPPQRQYEINSEYDNKRIHFAALPGDIVPYDCQDPTILGKSKQYFDSESSKYHRRFHIAVRQMWSVVIAVVAVLLLCCLYVLLIFDKLEKDEIVFHKTLPYQQDNEKDSDTEILMGSLLNASTIIAAVFVITMVFVVIFYFEASRALLRLMQSLMTLFMVAPWSYFTYQFCHLYHIPIDYLSYILIVWNLFLFAVYVFWYVAPRYPNSLLIKPCLIMICLSIAWPFLEQYEETLWVSLILLMIYDLIAVLLPFGPLRYIMKKADRVDTESMLGLVYRGEEFLLGLGDMVFFGVLAGRAARVGIVTMIATSIAVLFGLICTVVWTLITTQKAVPALPISLVFGLLTYFSTPRIIIPFCIDLAHTSIHV